MADISDILANISRDAFAEYDETYASADTGRLHSGQADLQALTRAWVNERGAAELQPWPKDGLIERANALVKSQCETVETMTGDMDPKANFSLIIIQTEVERWKFLLRALLRARLSKIDRHALHYLSTLELRGRLSESELAYATRHQQLLHGHYLRSFLGAFPERLQNLNDTAGGISMVEGPDAEEAVFVRGLGRGDENVVVFGKNRDVDGDVEVQRGEVVVARWADVKELVEKGELELV